MVPRLPIGPNTFTVERVRKILLSELDPGPTTWRGIKLVNCEFDILSLRHETIQSNVRRLHDPQSRAQRATAMVEELFAAAGSEHHIQAMDEQLSVWMTCNFRLKHNDLVGIEAAVEHACLMLQRLPQHPPPMRQPGSLNLYSDMPCRYLNDNEVEAGWGTLRVTTFLDRNLIRAALHAASNPPHDRLLEYINGMVQMLQIADDLSKAPTSHQDAHQWFIVKAFIWTTWQRSVLLHLSFGVRMRLRNASEALNLLTELKMDNTRLISTLSQTVGHDENGDQISSYMCRWAYELIRTDRASVGIDLRVFRERYNKFVALSGPENTKPRCVPGGDGKARQCDGTSPGHCKRFRDMRVGDQSSHTAACSHTPVRCRRLHWDETSYRSIEGARAVIIDHEPADGLLRYQKASEATMAISHVWCHGQGGRPEKDESGFNECLHRRYSAIASSHGCDSYWMDTPCVPNDAGLRKEAIGEINNIFRDSGLTLVCDKDLMAIDIENPSLETKEMILAVILVCDWNIRAWTFLEAVRGQMNLHILCKNDRTVSIASLLEDVSQTGCLDLVALFFTSHHLLPYTYLRYLSVEEAACVLSRRYTTKDGDELIIWSLLCGETAYRCPKDFWSSARPRGRAVQTGFLLSGAPRVTGHPGLGWAPCRPDLPIEATLNDQRGYYTYDGPGTATGLFDEEGLRAEWRFCAILGYDTMASLKRRLTDLIPSLANSADLKTRELAMQHLRKYRWGAILEVAEDQGEPWGGSVAASYRGFTNGPMAILVGSHDRLKWEWLCVVEWDPSIELPDMKRKKILII